MTDATATAPGAPTAERLLSLVAAMEGRPVVVVADLVADRFITATPTRISREAPVPILTWEGERLVPGGGANAVANVRALGGRPLPLGVVGDDESGRGLVAALEREGVDVSGIAVRPDHRTSTKTRLLAGARGASKQQVARWDVEGHHDLGPDDRRAYWKKLAAWEREWPEGVARVAAISDYGYGAALPDLVTGLRHRLGEGATLLVDSRYRLGEYSDVDGATPNEDEAEALLGHRLPAAPGPAAADADELRHRLGARWLLLTRGSRGMLLATDDGAASVPVHGTDQVADVTGAGDTVTAAFALALAAGASPLEAALLADYAGGVVVMKAGTATLDRGELAAAIAADPAPREELRWDAW